MIIAIEILFFSFFFFKYIFLSLSFAVCVCNSLCRALYISAWEIVKSMLLLGADAFSYTGNSLKKFLFSFSFYLRRQTPASGLSLSGWSH